MHWQWIFNRVVLGLAFVCVLIAIYAYSPAARSGKRNAARTPPDPEEPLPPSSSPLHRFKRAGIATDNDACSQMAREALLLGGSVVDAALAALLCNGLIGMQSMGLGGGMIMNIYMHSERRAYTILGREMAPRSLHADNFTTMVSEQQLKQSGRSIAVPTELLGYALAHERFGKLSWSELVRPTLSLCHSGYSLYKHQYDALILNADMIKSNALLRQMFVDPATNQFWPIGRHIQPPKQLCDTYAQISVAGPRSLYKGTLLARLHADLQDMGSAITKEDLRHAQAELRDSLVIPLDEYDLHLTPPPGSGHILGLIMNILHAYRADFAAGDDLDALAIHRIVEAFKFGFVQRWRLDDKADEELLAKLTSPRFAARIAQLIDDARTYNNSEHYGASGDIQPRDEHGTSHISILHNNDAVSVTSSINFYFGSGRMGKRTGVLFNNAMSDFSMKQLKNYFDLPYIDGTNMITAAARPMSSMCPIIVTERSSGQVRLVVGAAGGTKIISALVPLLVRILWQRASIKTAIDASRFHHQMLPNVLQYEYGMLQAHVHSLLAKGHQCERYRNRGSVICGIAQDNESVTINSDYRKIGGVAGF
ncbi:PREDICTED: gamma-glutamyltranspeptidase 1 [Drosophila arizonae]|uniref:Gamma-glutamyltranspeptidase 1 n=1 Tax=Drosophila arizonae TaxID=7263 RepID=A0ABM1PW89_DROAR|nr:PREDICTED: gamma-glutamyltranspeptidase 1 [Drosophila arizonae]